VADLLSTCQQVKALVTSREGLRLRGEQQLPVPTLALPDRKPGESIRQLTGYEAVRLFIERAQAVKVDFAVFEQNADAVAEICRRLDGLPLAIELAAARVNVLSPQAMLARLEHRLAVLTGGPRDLPARQQTLRQAIAWSYDLLPSAEAGAVPAPRGLRRGCTWRRREAVIGVDEANAGLWLLDGIASLVDKSLLRRDEREMPSHASGCSRRSGSMPSGGWSKRGSPTGFIVAMPTAVSRWPSRRNPA